MKIITLFVFVLAAVSAAGKVFYTKAGQRVVLECGVDSFKSSVVWRNEASLIVNMDRRFHFPRKGSSDLAKRSRLIEETNLQISGVTEGDAGRFSCEADGNLNKHTLLVVSVSASPPDKLELNKQATLYCRVQGLNPGSTVQWRGPTRSVDKDTVEMNPVASSDAGTWVCVITQDGVTHNENLTITVKEPVTTTLSPTQTSKNTPKSVCPDCAGVHQLSWWVWVAVGVGCLIMVLLIVCVIVLCKSIRRRKKTFLRMQNSAMGPKQYCQCNRPTAAARPQQGRRKKKPSALPLQP